MLPPGASGKRSAEATHDAIALPWVSSTPFGGPVVPDV